MFFFFFFLSIIVVVTAFLLANRTSFVCFFWVFFFIHRAGAFYGEVERPWVSFCFVFFLPFFCFFLKTIRFNVNRAICMRFACDMPAICMRFAYRRPILIDRRLGPKKGAQNSPTFFCFCFFFLVCVSFFYFDRGQRDLTVKKKELQMPRQVSTLSLLT